MKKEYIIPAYKVYNVNLTSNLMALSGEGTTQSVGISDNDGSGYEESTDGGQDGKFVDAARTSGSSNIWSNEW